MNKPLEEPSQWRPYRVHFIRRLEISAIDLPAKSMDDAIDRARTRRHELVWHSDDADELEVANVEPLDASAMLDPKAPAPVWCPLPIEEICKETP